LLAAKNKIRCSVKEVSESPESGLFVKNAKTGSFAHNILTAKVLCVSVFHPTATVLLLSLMRESVGADEKNRIEILSRLVADLSVKSTSGNDLTSKINRLRGEIKKVIDHEDTIFGKFRGLVESFREIIPDEKQRYHAAIKAMSAT
jgi:hypothetical protein